MNSPRITIEDYMVKYSFNAFDDSFLIFYEDILIANIPYSLLRKYKFNWVPFFPGGIGCSKKMDDFIDKSIKAHDYYFPE